MTFRLAAPPLKYSLSLVSAGALALGLAPATPARADLGEVVAIGIIGTAVYCGVSGKCTSKPQARAGGGGGSYGDAIPLSGQNAMLVQGGLKSFGFYTGAIDGAIGSGTRNAIRAYQDAIGAPRTGVLTGQQINDLVALSPGYVTLAADDPAMFISELANDLDRNGVRQLQAALNQQGYPAGSVDGAFGNQTRTAIASYKAANGLPGKPLATRRLLAWVMGWVAPEPAGAHLVAARRGVTPPAPAPQPAVMVPAPAPQPVPPAVIPDALSFDILGVRLGMSEADVKNALTVALGETVMFDRAGVSSIGAVDGVTHGLLTVQFDWPHPPAEQVMVLFDEARPDAGALAVFRLVRMPDELGQAGYETQMLPDILANYGAAGKVAGRTMWVGKAAARGGDVAACGAPQISVDTGVTDALAGLWRSGGGPKLDGGFGSVSADCGQVLSVDFAGNVVRFGLWDSAAFAGGGAAAPAVQAPKIKF
ncbi:MAG: hypothetical protein CSA74_11370 [Rhodobacterales bacterium]|nr:MAG: hypothetical protein CSA74_11370 [Rhodobacterales bacterium]